MKMHIFNIPYKAKSF